MSRYCKKKKITHYICYRKQTFVLTNEILAEKIITEQSYGIHNRQFTNGKLKGEIFLKDFKVQMNKFTDLLLSFYLRWSSLSQLNKS